MATSSDLPLHTLPNLAGILVFERGWLSSNNILLCAAPGEDAWLVDTGHSAHAPQTVALVQHALQGRALTRIVNTHLHSDHCGGNAALQAVYPKVRISVAPSKAPAVATWDRDALSHGVTGQHCERFVHTDTWQAGETLHHGGRCWEVVAAPGHDPDAMMLFDAQDGVLLSADALWENGFGVVFPELDGQNAFDQVDAVLRLIEQLAPRWVIPGHGRPFDDVGPALQRAHQRLSKFTANPAGHARHAAKVLVKYHLMEERQQALNDLLDWADHTPLLHSTLRQAQFSGTPRQWCEMLLAELVSTGAVGITSDPQHQQVIHDA